MAQEALGLAALSILFWGVWGFFWKLGIADLGPRQTAVWAYITYAIVDLSIIAALWYSGARFSFATGSMPIIAGAVIGTFGTFIFIYFLSATSASIAVPLTALYPAVTVALAFFLLAEQLAPHHVAGILLALAAGVLLSLP